MAILRNKREGRSIVQHSSWFRWFWLLRALYAWHYGQCNTVRRSHLLAYTQQSCLHTTYTRSQCPSSPRSSACSTTKSFPTMYTSETYLCPTASVCLQQNQAYRIYRPTSSTMCPASGTTSSYNSVLLGNIISLLHLQRLFTSSTMLSSTCFYQSTAD